jgi:signal transduction histidine kinase
MSTLEMPLVPLFENAAQVRNSSEALEVNAVQLQNKVLDLSMMPIKDASGFSLGHVLLLAEDVTAQETTKQKLVESERLAAIGRIAAQITHEIRNPLSAIGLNIELLEDDIPALPEHRQKEALAILGSVAGEIDRLTAITEGYLRVAKLPTGQNRFNDIGDLLADLCAFSLEEAAQNEVRLELRVGQNLPSVSFDEGRLRQALLNLLQNALSVAGRGGTVRLSASEDESGGVKITISDTGPGISLENKDKIFEPFFTTRKKGTGLGLTLTREILNEHDTQIEVSDSNLGGASFSFVLKPGLPPKIPQKDVLSAP